MADTIRKNTDAGVRGGAARSSDEALVMRVERRGSVIRLRACCQLARLG
jgi:hypothetical protein